jgi:hypothetical protein
MNQSTIDARVCFARNCVAGASRASRRGERRLAAELRASAREALAGLGAAVAPAEGLDRASPSDAVRVAPQATEPET